MSFAYLWVCKNPGSLYNAFSPQSMGTLESSWDCTNWEMQVQPWHLPSTATVTPQPCTKPRYHTHEFFQGRQTAFSGWLDLPFCKLFHFLSLLAGDSVSFALCNRGQQLTEPAAINSSAPRGHQPEWSYRWEDGTKKSLTTVSRTKHTTYLQVSSFILMSFFINYFLLKAVLKAT